LSSTPTGIFLASKTEEYFGLEVVDIQELSSDPNLSETAVREMEISILQTLNFKTYGLTALDFMVFLDCHENDVAKVLLEAIYSSSGSEIVDK
jgi:hypothetical protein